MGDHDHVRDALADAGATLDFWRIAIKPGKPLIAGALGSTRVIGLPGNPVSSYVCALLFAIPVVQRMLGLPGTPDEREARLGGSLPANGPRRDHIRAWRDGMNVTALPTQDSAQMAVLARANALIVRPAGAPAAEIGDFVPIMPLDRF